MPAPIPYAELKTITKEKRRNAALLDPKRTKDRIDDIVMRATMDNPVSILDFNKCTDFARHCLMLGASDQDAVEAVRKFIQQLNSNPVG